MGKHLSDIFAWNENEKLKIKNYSGFCPSKGLINSKSMPFQAAYTDNITKIKPPWLKKLLLTCTKAQWFFFFKMRHPREIKQDENEQPNLNYWKKKNVPVPR